jgi:DNA-binding CsgD family transcriptional regulator
MLHRRLLNSLDTSSPLLLVETVYGSGVRTGLRQWEERGGHRDGELRMLFDARRIPTCPRALVRLLWSALRHRISHDLPELPDENALLRESVVRALQDIRRPMTLAIHEAEQLSAATLGVLLHVLDGGVRLVIAGYDLSHLREEEREIWLDRSETHALLAERGTELSAPALTTLHHATLGHPGAILASLASMPIEVEAGLVTRDRALAAFLVEQPLLGRAGRFARFFRRAAHLPRFTAAEAAALSDGGNALTDLRRLHDLGLGTMVWHPGMRERVFRWTENIRQVVLRAISAGPEAGEEAASRVLAVARSTGDEELLLSMLVAAGELDEAEAVLRERVWDLLPNAMAPLWMPLMRISPLRLVDRPALLAARLRLGAHRSRSPVAVRAAQRALPLRIAASEAGEDRERIGALAYALDLALYVGDRERMIEIHTRVRAQIAELVRAEAIETVGGREVSELLLIADTVFRSGNTIPAAEIARFGAQMIEVDPGGLDPLGERLDFVRRLILHDHRARGLEDVLDASVLLAGIQFLRHDCDIVVAGMTLMWQALDDGRVEDAEAHLRAAAERLADPEGWPILQLMRAHMAVHRRALEEFERYVSAFERSTLATPGPFAQQTHSQIQRIADYMSRHAGRPVPSPGYLPVTPVPGRPFYPRTEFTVHLMEALYAVRDDRVPAARAALAKAVALTPRRELGLYTLAHATPEEVRALREVAADLPGGEQLRLERADGIAGILDSPTLEISEREQEVLAHLRRGATNPEMAKAMFVSVNTVKFHRANLMRKLGASSRDELLQEASVRGL